MSFHPQGNYLLSTSNEGVVKVWDLRRGHILYTLYGHEGPTSSGNFSPGGDYFLTGGKDAVILIWTSNINQTEQEVLHGLSTKVETEVFMTEKEVVSKLPTPHDNTENVPPHKGAAKKHGATVDKAKLSPMKPGTQYIDMPRKMAGPSYKQLKPEVKGTIDRVMYELDLVCKTMNLLENRLAMSENKMHNVLETIKDNDLGFRPVLSESVIPYQQARQTYNEIRSQVDPVEPRTSSPAKNKEISNAFVHSM